MYSSYSHVAYSTTLITPTDRLWLAAATDIVQLMVAVYVHAAINAKTHAHPPIC